MPYITQHDRKQIYDGCQVNTAGELNFKITQVIMEVLSSQPLNYHNINTVIGVLECAKLELYRRVAVPYEDQKCKENGDVYT